MRPPLDRAAGGCYMPKPPGGNMVLRLKMFQHAPARLFSTYNGCYMLYVFS